MRENWRGIIAAIACISIVGTGLSVSFPLLSVMMERAGISATVNGANTAVGGLAILFIAPFTSYLVVRIGVVRLLAGSIVLAMLSLVGFYFTAPPWPWFPLRFLFGVAIGLLFVVSEFWINALVHDHRRGFVIGIYGTMLSIGFAAGPAILLITGTQGVAPFIAALLLFAIGAVPVVLAGDAAPKVEGRAGGPFLGFLLVAPVATLAGLVFGAVESAGYSLLPVYGIRLDYTEGQAAMLITMMALGGVAWQIPLGLLSDRMDRRLLLALCGAFSVLGALLMGYFASRIWIAYSLLFLFGGIVGGLYTVGLAHLGSRFRGADLAAANAAFVTLYSIGMLIGPATAGLGMDIWRPHGFIGVLGLYLLFFTLIAAWRYLHDADAAPDAAK